MIWLIYYLALSWELKQAISRVLFLMTINLVPMLPPESSGLPGGLKADHFIPLYLAFLPAGFTMPLQSLRERWALTLIRLRRTHLFTLTLRDCLYVYLVRRYIFCGTFLGITPTLCYRALYPVELGLSSSKIRHVSNPWSGHPACFFNRYLSSR